jgi:hypothetical protein
MRIPTAWRTVETGQVLNSFLAFVSIVMPGSITSVCATSKPKLRNISYIGWREA